MVGFLKLPFTESAVRDFEAAWREHRPQLVVLARSKVGDLNTAEDIVQESAIGALRGWAAFPDKVAPLPWFRKIVEYKCVDWIRARASKRVLPTTMFSDRPNDPIPDPRALPPDKILASREELARIEASIEQLHDPERSCLRLRLLDDLTFAEVARQLGIPEGTAKSSYSRGIKKLRARLTDHDRTD